MAETVTKDKKSKLPRINKKAIVAKMARVANGQWLKRARVAKTARMAEMARVTQTVRRAKMPRVAK